MVFIQYYTSIYSYVNMYSFLNTFLDYYCLLDLSMISINFVGVACILVLFYFFKEISVN